MKPSTAVMSSVSMPLGGMKDVTETTSLSDILADCAAGSVKCHIYHADGLLAWAA